ncbi:hypothetical protein DEO72_LG4g762 [Vigna unguiculata]|uniref:Uncharacterized protein n=1 Tax=Vigna unguiculata TaxID=3917 RepID=A0A4D6LLZ4_VIGUN|nr:hypothetical protein DEO72_LG4g762 [Vigna unguiculata]
MCNVSDELKNSNLSPPKLAPESPSFEPLEDVVDIPQNWSNRRWHANTSKRQSNNTATTTKPEAKSDENDQRIHSYLKNISQNPSPTTKPPKGPRPSHQKSPRKANSDTSRLPNSHVFSPHLTPDQTSDQTVPPPGTSSKIPAQLSQQHGHCLHVTSCL